MKKNISPRRKIILTICLIVGVVLAMAGGTLAIYTSQVYQRAVVRNRYNDVIRFSSDKLYRKKDTENPPQKYYYPVGDNQISMTFSVCNYDQVNNTLFSENDIDYNINFKVTNGTDGFKYIVSCGDQGEELKNGGILDMSGNLQGGRRSVQTYTITFDKGDYDKVEIEVIVTPDEPTTTQGRILNGILIPIKYATTQGVRLSQEFIDSTRGKPNQFDAYNLLISVSGGEGKVVIAWNSTQLDIDPFFVTASSGTPGTAENGYKTLTVSMNSEDETGTYLISFYNHNITDPGWTDWENLPIDVQLEESNSGSTVP